MRTVTSGGMVAAVAWALLSFAGAPAAPAMAAEPVVAPAQISPDAEETTEPPWGLVGLTGLLGLAGLARKRRRVVVADPFASYPAMRKPGTVASTDPRPPTQEAPARPRPTPRPRAVSRADGAAASTGKAANPTVYLPSPVPEQNRGTHERLSAPPKPESSGAFPPPPPTSVRSDGHIRLAPAPPLHADRLSPPNLDISGLPGMADATPAEPRWPQHEYD